jgi:hypothetical protein
MNLAGESFQPIEPDEAQSVREYAARPSCGVRDW